MARIQVTDEEIELAVNKVRSMLEGRLRQKGKGTFASTHEIYGVIAEEFDELGDELRNNNSEAFKNELMDIAVGAIFGVACIDAMKTDW